MHDAGQKRSTVAPLLVLWACSSEPASKRVIDDLGSTDGVVQGLAADVSSLFLSVDGRIERRRADGTVEALLADESRPIARDMVAVGDHVYWVRYDPSDVLESPPQSPSAVVRVPKTGGAIEVLHSDDTHWLRNPFVAESTIHFCARPLVAGATGYVGTLARTGFGTAITTSLPSGLECRGFAQSKGGTLVEVSGEDGASIWYRMLPSGDLGGALSTPTDRVGYWLEASAGKSTVFRATERDPVRAIATVDEISVLAFDDEGALAISPSGRECDDQIRILDDQRADVVVSHACGAYLAAVSPTFAYWVEMGGTTSSRLRLRRTRR